MEENKTRNINNLQKELHQKTESFYKNVFLRSYECFLDLFLINIGPDNNNNNNDDDDEEKHGHGSCYCRGPWKCY